MEHGRKVLRNVRTGAKAHVSSHESTKGLREIRAIAQLRCVVVLALHTLPRSGLTAAVTVPILQ